MLNSTPPTQSPSMERSAVARDLTALIKPRGIVVLGASARRSAGANFAIENLRASNFCGEVHVVHPQALSVDGMATEPSIASLPRNLDLALVSLPAPSVLNALRELESTGCRAAIVPAVGLTAADRSALADLTNRSKMLVHGPNTMGLINVADRIPMVFYKGVLSDVRVGNVALVAQSGGACISVVKTTERAGFSRIIPSGSEWCLSAGDYLAWLAQDAATDAVGVVLESFSDIPGFTKAIRLLRERGKPVVVLRAGKSLKGAAAAAAHTEALIGRPQIYETYFRELDVAVVDDYDEMAAVLDTFSVRTLPRALGRNIACIATSGGMAALAADIASQKGVNLVEFNPSTKASLESILPGSVGLNPYDSGASTVYSADSFAEAIRIVARDPQVDSILALLDSQASLTPAEFEYGREDFVAVAQATHDIRDKPVVVASSGSGNTHEHCAKLLGDRVPLVRGLANGFVVMRSLGLNRATIAAIEERVVSPVPAAIKKALLDFAASGGGVMRHELACSLLTAYEIPTVRSTVVPGQAQAAEVASAWGFPLVVKVVSPDIAHRSDVGGVITGVVDHTTLRTAIERVLSSVAHARPDARIEGIEIQENIQTKLESMVGFITDPIFGPLISVGLGGVLVEVLQDSAFARAPIDTSRATELIGATRLAKVASGYRNLVPATDLGALAVLLSKFSRLARDHCDLISAADLNPVLIAEGNGAVTVVDQLFMVRAVDRDTAAPRSDSPLL